MRTAAVVVVLISFTVLSVYSMFWRLIVLKADTQWDKTACCVCPLHPETGSVLLLKPDCSQGQKQKTQAFVNKWKTRVKWKEKEKVLEAKNSFFKMKLWNRQMSKEFPIKSLSETLKNIFFSDFVKYFFKDISYAKKQCLNANKNANTSVQRSASKSVFFFFIRARYFFLAFNIGHSVAETCHIFFRNTVISTSFHFLREPFFSCLSVLVPVQRFEKTLGCTAEADFLWL